MNHLRGSVGEGAGFVEGQLGNLGQALQRIALAHQKAVARGVADGRHDGRRRGEHQRAGAEDDQDGDGADDLAADQPGQRGGAEGDDHDPGGPAVCKAHDLGLTRIRRLHQAHHPLDGAVLAHLGGPHLKGAELVDRAAGNLVADGLIYGQGLSRHHRLVDRGLAAENDAVHRNGLAGQDAQYVANPHLLHGHHVFLVAVDDAGGLGREVHQLFDARAGLGHRQILQQRPQLHDEGHLARGKVLADAHGGDQGRGDQHIRLDVEGGDKADEGFQ